MPRAGLHAELVVRRAAELMDAHPDQELSLATLAKHLEVQPPSLYKHVRGIKELRRLVMLDAKAALARELMTATAQPKPPATETGANAARALADAYRRYARAHPALYPLTVQAPVPGDVADEEVSAALLGAVTTVLAPHAPSPSDAVHTVRAFRAVVHGFISLEALGAFALPVELERSFALAVDRALGDQAF